MGLPIGGEAKPWSSQSPWEISRVCHFWGTWHTGEGSYPVPRPAGGRCLRPSELGSWQAPGQRPVRSAEPRAAQTTTALEASQSPGL